MATSQGLRGPPRNWKRQGTVSPEILQWERGPGSTLIEDFWPQELLFSVTHAVVTHDSSSRKQINPPLQATLLTHSFSKRAGPWPCLGWGVAEKGAVGEFLCEEILTFS